MSGTLGFRALLLLYPPAFRAEYGDEMLRIYEDLRRDESRWRVFVRLARDTAVAAPRLRMEEGMKRNLAIVTAVVLFGVAFVGTITGNYFMGAGILAAIGALLLGPSVLIARRTRRSSEFEYTIKRWPWWTFVAAGMAATYVLFGAAQLAQEPKGTNVAALFILAAFGAMMARGLVLRRRGSTSGDWLVALAALPFTSLFWLVWPPIVTAAVMVGAMSEALSVRPARPA